MRLGQGGRIPFHSNWVWRSIVSYPSGSGAETCPKLHFVKFKCQRSRLVECFSLTFLPRRLYSNVHDCEWKRTNICHRTGAPLETHCSFPIICIFYLIANLHRPTRWSLDGRVVSRRHRVVYIGYYVLIKWVSLHRPMHGHNGRGNRHGMPTVKKLVRSDHICSPEWEFDTGAPHCHLNDIFTITQRYKTWWRNTCIWQKSTLPITTSMS